MAKSALSSPILYNMGGLNPQGNQAVERQAVGLVKVANGQHGSFWCGLDWLALTLSINWGADWQTDHKTAGNDIRAKLEAGQVAAMDRGEPVVLPEWGGATIHPGGGKIAKKYCRFKIELESATILIADQPTYKGDWPNPESVR